MTVRAARSGAWATLNPILEHDEFGIEVDTGRYKVGNGLSRWAELSHVTTPTLNEDVIDGGPP